jgi:hypothetical protein
MKKKNLLILTFGLFINLNYAQEKMILKLKSFACKFLNPAVELEIPTGKYSTFLGSDWLWRISDLTYGGNGFIYIISPFADFQQKWCNLNKETKPKYGK